LDHMPFVDRDIFQVNEHLMPPIWFGESPWVSMITSRGCMFNCAFCAPASRIMFGRTVRRRSPANVIDELKVLRDKYAFKFLRFYDDNIIENEKWTREFCRLFKENDFSATFGIAGRADLICRHESLMALLAQTGMIEMNIGFESGSQRVLDFLNKRTTVQQNIQAADILKKFGIKVIVSVMFGIPGETRHDILKTVELLDKTNPDWVDPAFLSPYPGSAIHEYCSHKGLTIVQESRAYERSLGSAPKIRGADYDFAIDALGHRYGNRANWPDSAAE
jgi:anaerobic magnesium-protoporphyrin IX monomethyl ester cyclase